MRRKGIVILVTAVVLIVAGAGFGLSRFSLSALEEPGPMETYLATRAKRWLVGRAAGSGATPPREEDPMSRVRGQAYFTSSCAPCHGFDGRTPSQLGRSLYPPSPDLGSAEVQAWSNEELFWIVKHGIRMTGMPGFARIHSDEEIWDMVRFLRTLEKKPESGQAGD